MPPADGTSNDELMAGLMQEEREREDQARLKELDDQVTRMERDRKDFERLKILGLHREGPNGRIFLEHSAIAEHLHRRLHTLLFNEKVWIYYPETGTYRKNKGEIQTEIKRICESVGFKGSISREVKDILFYLMTINRHRESPFNKGIGLIPVRNGVIRVTHESVDLLPHSPEYMFTYQLPVRYDPGANTDRIISILEEWVGEDRDFLTQIPAQTFLQLWGGVYKAAYLLLGPPDGGKSSYLELLTALIGRECISRTGLHTLCSSQFALAPLVGKLINLEDDLPSIPLSMVGPFKMLTGGQDLQVEKKYEEAYNAILTPVLVFTANIPPEITRDIEDSAFWSRWNILPFGNKFPVNPEFKKELLKEENLSAFLNFVIRKIQEIQAGAFMRMNPEEMKTLWIGSSSSIIKFYEDILKKDPEGYLLKEEVYPVYQAYTVKNKLPCETKTAFTIKMQQLGVQSTRETAGNRRYIYKGIFWKQPGENPDKSDVKETPSNLSDFFSSLHTGEKEVQKIVHISGAEKPGQVGRDSVTQNESTLPEKPGQVGRAISYVQVRVHGHLDPFVGVDGETYQGRLGAIVVIPSDNATALINRGLASLVHPAGGV